MTPNMRMPERVIRIIVGVGLLGLYGALPAPWRYLTLFGLILIGTGISGFCPAWHLLQRRDAASHGGPAT
jgi:hypothetical protein